MLTVNWEKDGFLYHWPESQRLKSSLDTNKFGMCYTMPGLKSEERLGSKKWQEYESVFNDHFGHVSGELNAKGFSILLKNNQLELALNGTTVLLSEMGQGLNKIGRTSTNTEQTLAIWSLRFQLLMLLKMYPQAIEEMAAFEDLDAPDLFYQYYPQLNRKGTLVPFGLRLIHAEILRYTPFPWKALERLERLRKDVGLVIKDLATKLPEASLKLWQKRLVAVEKIHARLLFCLGEVRQSFEVLQVAKKEADLPSKEKICFEMMRIALTVGDDATANQQLLEAANSGIKTNDLLLHKALRAMFLGAHSHASEYVQRLNKTDDKRKTVPNTAAIACLYTGKAVEGVQLLSRCNKPIPEHVMTNIRSMSELGLPAAQKDCLLRDLEE